MKKKIVALAMAVTMGLSLFGCGASGAKSVSNDYIKVNDYNKLKIQKVEATQVTDEDVSSEIEANLESSKKTKEVKRAAKDGDVVNIDYTGKVKGKAFDGGTAEEQDLELGSGNFIGAEGKYKGFEEQIVGHKAGEKFTITVKFPESYSEELAGKVATFDIKLNKVSEYEEVELNDAWVKENSETSKTVDEYKAEIKKQLQDNYDKETASTLKNEAMTALLDQIEEVKEPEEEIKKEAERLKEQVTQQAQMYGIEFKDMIAGYGYTEEQFEKELQTAAKQNAELAMALELIANEEKILTSDDAYKELYEQLAKDNGYESGDALIEAVGEDEVKQYLLRDKVCDFLVEHAEQLSEAEMATATTAASETETSAESDTAAESTTEK